MPRGGGRADLKARAVRVLVLVALVFVVVIAGSSESRQAAPLRVQRWRSMLRIDSAALLDPGSRGVTRCTRFARCARTDAASQRLDARCARRPRPCAARRPLFTLRVPPATTPHQHDLPGVLGAQRAHHTSCSSSKSDVPTACTGRPSCSAFAGHRRRRGWKCTAVPEGAFGSVAARRRRRREAQGSWPARAARHVLLTRRPLSERRERSERSELDGGPRDRASQGSPCEAWAAYVEATQPTRTHRPRGLRSVLRSGLRSVLRSDHRTRQTN